MLPHYAPIKTYSSYAFDSAKSTITLKSFRLCRHFSFYKHFHNSSFLCSNVSISHFIFKIEILVILQQSLSKQHTVIMQGLKIAVQKVATFIKIYSDFSRWNSYSFHIIHTVDFIYHMHNRNLIFKSWIHN